ncbi:MAG: hypothetical protein LAO51_13450 [Acidobacteriia bacterium]|nr:hypothetical protein [Terriglobia bacterium]
MRQRRVPIAAALLALGGVWLASPPSQALNTKQLNLADMVRQSAEIVSGTVTAVDQGIDQRGLPYTQVQVKVAETIRGTAVPTLTFRQFGLQTAQPAADGRKFLGLVAGMPRYAKGDQVFLFLSQPSTIGLRTTVGLEQGRFALRGGNLYNGANNAGLFRGVDLAKARLNVNEKSMVATQQGAVHGDTFLGLVRRAVSEKWWDTPPEAPKPPVATRPQVRVVKEGGLAQ